MMNIHHLFSTALWPTIIATLLAGGLSGCQTTVAGQTLPSAYYLRDDVQYFPTGPETQLPNQRRALEEYRLEQQAGGLDNLGAP